jgi:SAM-dependent methyltransferase
MASRNEPNMDGHDAHGARCALAMSSPAPLRPLRPVRALGAPLLIIAIVAIVVPVGARQTKRLRPPDVRFVGTPQNVVEAMLDLARVTSADVVYDLGSGDGRIPITAAAKYGARGVGIEIDPARIRESLDNLARAGVGSRVRFVNQDLFDADISGATVVTLFLLPRLNLELMPKLKRELRPGARVVSHQFTMGDGWLPEMSRDVDGLMIYLWTIR